jgi:hypothetical protein
MKTITLKEAHDILSDCSAVILDGNALMYPDTADLEDDPTNEFLYLSYIDEGLDYNVKFVEENNQNVTIEGAFMTLTDNEGDKVILTILEPKQLLSKSTLLGESWVSSASSVTSKKGDWITS